jgi:hypothetical protein
MQRDRPHDRVDEIVGRPAVGEVAHGLEPARQFSGRRRLVKDIAEIISHHSVFVRSAKAPARRRVIKRLVRDQTMNREHHFK